MSAPDAVPELPPALADVSLDAIEELERSSGQSFGEMIEELAAGRWSISTMRALLGLVNPDAEPPATMGELMVAAQELMGKVTAGEPAP